MFSANLKIQILNKKRLKSRKVKIIKSKRNRMRQTSRANLSIFTLFLIKIS